MRLDRSHFYLRIFCFMGNINNKQQDGQKLLNSV